MGSRNIFKTGIVNIIFLLGFLLLMYWAGGSVLLPAGGNLKFVLLVFLVFVPSLISMLFYYLQDKERPEPVGTVTYAFFAGMAAAALGVIPLWHLVFQVQEWIYSATGLFVLGAFLVLAPVVSILLYIVLRYGFLPLPEFDEPVDGMVYGAVAGVGMAFAVSFHHLINRPDCTLFVIAYVSTTHILIYSAVGALIGYILARSKFCSRNVDRNGLYALILGIVLLGVYHVVNEIIFVSGFGAAFWLSFFLTLLYALSGLSYGAFMMRRLASRKAEPGLFRCPKFDILSAIFILVLLAAGQIVSLQGQAGRLYRNSEYGFSFRCPHTFSQLPFGSPDRPDRLLSGRLRKLFSRQGGAGLPVSVSVLAAPVKEAEGIPELMQFVEVMETESMTVEYGQVSGEKSTRIVYSYLQDSQGIQEPFPQLIQVYADLVPRDSYLVIFVYRASAEYFFQGKDLYEKLLRSVRWQYAER